MTERFFDTSITHTYPIAIYHLLCQTPDFILEY
jgi:hypothetical protein